MDQDALAELFGATDFASHRSCGRAARIGATRVWSVAGVRTGVGERPRCLGNESPVVGAVAESELEDAVRTAVKELAVGLPRAQRVVAAAAGAHDELTDAARRVGVTSWALRREALIVVVVAAQDDVGVRVI